MLVGGSCGRNSCETFASENTEGTEKSQGSLDSCADATSPKIVGGRSLRTGANFPFSRVLETACFTGNTLLAMQKRRVFAKTPSWST
jgi:hypothetical protein